MTKKKEFNFSGKKPRQSDSDTAISSRVQLDAKKKKKIKKPSK